MARKPVRRAATPRRKPQTRTRSTRKSTAKKAAAKAGVKASSSRRVVKAAKRAVKKAAKRAPARAQTATARKKSAGKPLSTARKKPSGRKAQSSRKAASPRKLAKPAASAAKARRPAAAKDRAGVPTPPSSLDMKRQGSAVRTGRAELAEARENLGAMQVITGGDVDANAENAYFSGDEAPGGDNPTPDQDIVDDIGRALGVEYQDAEELRGSDKVSARDKHRWELDPASAEDYKDRR